MKQHYTLPTLQANRNGVISTAALRFATLPAKLINYVMPNLNLNKIKMVKKLRTRLDCNLRLKLEKIFFLATDNDDHRNVEVCSSAS